MPKWTPEPCYEERKRNIELCEKIERLEKSLQGQLYTNTQLMQVNRRYQVALEEIAESDELATHVAQKALEQNDE